MYRNSILIDLFGEVKFGMEDRYVTDTRKIIINNIGFADIIICWFGVIATK